MIIIIADSWSNSIFLEMLDRNSLPEINDYLLSRGTLYTNVSSIFPSVSLSSHASILTGEYPSLHRIPGHRWRSCELGLYHNYIGMGVRNLNRDIAKEVNTVFESNVNVLGVSIQSLVYRGATISKHYLSTDSFFLLDKTSSLIRENPFRIFVVWLPKGDQLSHYYGPNSEAVKQEMINTSKGIGLLAKTLIQMNCYYDAKIVFLSDHGQREVKDSYNIGSYFDRKGLSVSINKSRLAEVNICTNGDSTAFVYFDNCFPEENILQYLKEMAFEKEIEFAFMTLSSGITATISHRGISYYKMSDQGCKYFAVEGEDPLQNHELGLASDGTPEILRQYRLSYVNGRSARALIVASKGYHFGVTPRIGWRFGYHKGSHGGCSIEEMIVPAIVCNNKKEVIHERRDLINILHS